MRGALTLLIAMALIAGCATTIEKGESALRQGRYVDAERYFNEALTEDPSRVSALVGLGVTQYKRGGLDQAIETLPAFRAEGRSPEARAEWIPQARRAARRGLDQMQMSWPARLTSTQGG